MPDPGRSRYANLGQRAAAFVVDCLINLSVLFLIAFILRELRIAGMIQMPAGRTPEQSWRSLGVVAKLAVLVAYCLTLGLLYFPLLESSSWQGTVGKRVMKIYVTSKDGSRLSMRHAFGRWLAKYVFNVFPLVLVSMGMIAASDERKGMHDSVAGTVVVKGRPSPLEAVEPWRWVVAFGVPFVWTFGTFLATL